MSSDVPILFSGPMVRALRWGWKTQTRRLGASWGKRTPGDRLWVRETWSDGAQGVYPCPAYWYRADFSWMDDPSGSAGTLHDRGCSGNAADCWACVAAREGRFRWRPSIFMPRKACRLLLEVTAVRTEPLNALTEADALAEGIPRTHTDAWKLEIIKAVGPELATRWNTFSPVENYAALWDTIHPTQRWALTNPFVHVVTFKVVS